MVRLIEEPGFSADDIRWKSGQEVNTFLDGKQGSEGLGGQPVTPDSTQFQFPKFYRMLFYGRGIKAFRSVDITSTGFGEQSHALIKGAVCLTKRHDSDAINAQAATAFLIGMVCPKACEQGVPVMANKKDVMGYIAPADIQPLLDLLGGSKQLLKKFQGLLGLQSAGPSASCQTTVGKLSGMQI
ncbi:TPA: hypothetical protein ACH3X1_002645 [Trebouxia sp. C0004]